MILTYIYIVFLGITFLCSLISFRLHYPLHLKVFSVFIGVSLLTELLAFYLPGLLHLKTNMAIYNVYRLPEFLFTAWYFKQLIPVKVLQLVIMFLFIAYPLFWFWYLFYATSVDVWSGMLSNVINVFSILFAVTYLYRLYVSDKIIEVKRNAEFWIATGILFCAATTMPTFGVLLYLVKTDMDTALRLVKLLQVFNIIMYAIFVYAFLCRSMKTDG